MKIMLEADKCIYVLWREIILLTINSRNNYIEHGIKKNNGIFNRHHICRLC